MKKLLVVSLTIIGLAAFPVVSKEFIAAGSMGGGCMVENAQVSITLSGMETDVTAVKPKLDAKIAEIEKIFASAGLASYEIQSRNYNISQQGYGAMNGMFQFSGSVGYTVKPADKATVIMAELTKKGYQASVNVSAYRGSGGACTQRSERSE